MNELLWAFHPLQMRSLKGHTARVGSLAWNGPTLTTGSRDNLILNHDGKRQLNIANKLLLRCLHSTLDNEGGSFLIFNLRNEPSTPKWKMGNGLHPKP